MCMEARLDCRQSIKGVYGCLVISVGCVGAFLTVSRRGMRSRGQGSEGMIGFNEIKQALATVVCASMLVYQTRSGSHASCVRACNHTRTGIYILSTLIGAFKRTHHQVPQLIARSMPPHSDYALTRAAHSICLSKSHQSNTLVCGRDSAGASLNARFTVTRNTRATFRTSRSCARRSRASRRPSTSAAHPRQRVRSRTPELRPFRKASHGLPRRREASGAPCPTAA